MVWGDENWNLGLRGREVLVTLYDFNRKLGARQAVADAMPDLLEEARVRKQKSVAMSRFGRYRLGEA